MGRLIETASLIGFLFGLLVLLISLFFAARPRVVWAICWRNLKEYFTGPLGYVFIIVFVTVCAILTFSPQFFADNQASLDQLIRYYPLLLLFFIPALTMATWADEKKQGTDAILFTLPTTDLEILLGKYLALVLGYTIALGFSATQLIALSWISTPDWGVIAANYIGFWLAGLALLAIGMFASSLTSSATIAFVLAAILCAVPVLLGQYSSQSAWWQSMTIDWHLRDFALGLVSFPSVVYFLGLAIVFLYLNLVVITRRHWSRGQQGLMTLHFTVRFSFLLAGVLFLFLTYDRLSSYVNTRADLTGQRLYSLADTTRDAIYEAQGNDRPITIQAFISEEMPRQYVNPRKNLVGLLRQFERVGSNVHVEIVDVKPNSSEAKQAQTLGIEPRNISYESDGRLVEQEVFMGAQVSSTLGDVTLPFIDSSAIEYELASAIATTSNEQRKLVVGVLETDVHFDGLEIPAGPGESPTKYEWNFNTTLEELEKHYQFEPISVEELSQINNSLDAGNAAAEPTKPLKRAEVLRRGPDVLLVAGPSSLPALGLRQLQRYIERGRPTLLLDDPLPFYRFTYIQPEFLGVVNAPRQERITSSSAQFAVLSTDFDPNQRFAFIPPKASEQEFQEFLTRLGISWDIGTTVWDNNWPHVDFQPSWFSFLGSRWPAAYGPRDNLFVFVKKSGDQQPFVSQSPAATGLNELLFFYPGSIQSAAGTDLQFEPLVTLGRESGSMSWESLTEVEIAEQPVRGPRGEPQFNPSTGQLLTERAPVISPQTGLPVVAIRENVPSQFREVLAVGTVSELDEGLAVRIDQGTPADDHQVAVIREGVPARSGRRIASLQKLEIGLDPEDLKSGLPPEQFYELELDGEFELEVGDELQFYQLLPAYDDQQHVLAAHITSDSAGKQGNEDSAAAASEGINLIFVADYDFLTEYYHEQIEKLGSKLDNVMFIQNCIETLADRTEFVQLRARRFEPRTLTRIETRVRQYRAERFKEQLAFSGDIEAKLEEAQARLDASTQSVDADSDLSVLQKRQQSLQLESAENKRFQNEKEKLEEELDSKIEQLLTTEKEQIERDERQIRNLAVATAPLPAVALGLMVLISRYINERLQVSSTRRAGRP